MSVGSIGSTPSFWQQDQTYWQDAQSNDSSTAATDSIINAISSAETSQGKGLASIANQTALNRTNSQLTAAIENVLNGTTDSSSSSTSGSSSSSSTAAAPATGTGTAVLTTSTPLSLLGVLAGGTITVSAGSNLTTYKTTGSDTVGDLLNAINANDYGNAQVTAKLNSSGNLVITSKNDNDTFVVGGLYASNIGFAVGHTTFSPTKGSSSGSSTTSASTSSSSTTSSSSSSKSTSSSAAKTSYTTVASEISSSAASLLSDSGVGGTLVDMLA